MIRLLVNFLEFVLKSFYRDRWYARFYVLETIARVPYFAYVSVLHLYESLGYWDKSDWLKVHFAESWNELHHLRIAEALGGGERGIDRWISRIGVLVYYWILVFVYMIAPKSAYYFNQLVEERAYHTYDTFLNEYEDWLKTQPAPEVAVTYYCTGNLYMFDEFQIFNSPTPRRPKIENLYDVFLCIRNDEKEHIETMKFCQQPDAEQILKSPDNPELIDQCTSNPVRSQ
ncbi:MAG: alternative oxidase [Cyanobacteriota bacterium]